MPNNAALLGIVGSDGSVPSITDVFNPVDNIDTVSKPGVYIITPDDGSGFYIGATKNFKKRLKQHTCEIKTKKHSNVNLSNLNENVTALNFCFIETSTEEQAFSVESQLLEDYKDDKNLFNIKHGGTIPYMTGRTHSEETKEKIRQKHKESYLNGYVNPFKGKQHTQKTIETIKQKVTEYSSNPEYIEKCRLASLELMQDPTVREKCRAGAISQWQDPVKRANLLESRKEVASRPEWRQQMSVIKKESMQKQSMREHLSKKTIEAWNDPEKRKRMLDAKKDYVPTEETKIKTAEGIKKYYSNPENIEKSRQAAKDAWKDPEYRKKRQETLERNRKGSHV